MSKTHMFTRYLLAATIDTRRELYGDFPPNHDLNRTIILTLTVHDPDYHVNLTFSSVAHVQRFTKFRQKSVEYRFVQSY